MCVRVWRDVIFSARCGYRCTISTNDITVPTKYVLLRKEKHVPANEYPPSWFWITPPSCSDCKLKLLTMVEAKRSIFDNRRTKNSENRFLECFWTYAGEKKGAKLWSTRESLGGTRRSEGIWENQFMYKSKKVRGETQGQRGRKVSLQNESCNRGGLTSFTDGRVARDTADGRMLSKLSRTPAVERDEASSVANSCTARI